TLDNIIFSLQKMGGISVYWYELLKRFVNDEQCHLDIYQLKGGNEHVLASLINRLKLPAQLETTLPVVIARYLPFRLKVTDSSLFHSSYYRIAPGAKNVITIHDFTYEYYRTGLAKWVHTRQKAYAIKNAAGIICISENTKQDLFHFYPEVEVPVEVIHNGKSDVFSVLPETHCYSEMLNDLKDQKYVLFVGARAGYKNFSVLVDALASFDEVILVIVGAKLTSEEETYLTQKLKERFYFLGFVGATQLNELYNQAFCFIYPSEYEGFGIPVIEAMAAGCPVIALEKSSIPEVAGKAGLLYKQLDDTVLIDCFAILNDNKQRSQLIAQGLENAKQFSWDKCFAQTMDFYKKISRL
ncbi:MAG: glycosyltransferase family 4 protein, partial [Gammaproteobacteria bacterium]|nr:glycosyltransferase family 4 protein [Gammaproteobacteria bacterium]